jgi:hypothetical protein
LAEGEVEKLHLEFERWDNVPPADEVTYELGMFILNLISNQLIVF